MKKNKKLASILWSLAYLAVFISITASSCILFHNNYYTLIFVEGTSMTPTLNKNGKIEFGIVDEHVTAVNNIKRFDIITTYYPIRYHGSAGYISDYCYLDEYGQEVYTSYDDTDHKVQLSKKADFKIKRVMALPGESFRVSYDGIDVRKQNEDMTWGEITHYDFPFTHSEGNKTTGAFIQLKDDEYWVLGDNWSGSIDSQALNMPIKRGNISGVLVAIEGTCKVSSSNGKVSITNKKYYSQFRYF